MGGDGEDGAIGSGEQGPPPPEQAQYRFTTMRRFTQVVGLRCPGCKETGNYEEVCWIHGGGNAPRYKVRCLLCNDEQAFPEKEYSALVKKNATLHTYHYIQDRPLPL